MVRARPETPINTSDPRLAALGAWLERELNGSVERIAPASEDASFRRYFRLWRGSETFIVMDAPPDKEDIAPYVAVARMLADTGVNVPRILAEERAQGFVLLTDLGSHLYLEDLVAGRHVQSHYADALRALCRIQSRGARHAADLAPYDEARLLAEMRLMPEWFCRRHLGLELSAADAALLEEVFAGLTRAALAQPQVFVHRDYHSRNLMVCADNPGILDFQDAVRGAITYDLVSLLKDCYVQWPRERVVRWVADYRAMAQAAGVAVAPEEAQFLRDFDLMGVQRHLKVLGIFARLFHRDGKARYLADLPRVLGYVRETCAMYAELGELGEFLGRRVAPLLAERTAARQAAGAGNASLGDRRREERERSV